MKYFMSKRSGNQSKWTICLVNDSFRMTKKITVVPGSDQLILKNSRQWEKHGFCDFEENHCYF